MPAVEATHRARPRLLSDRLVIVGVALWTVQLVWRGAISFGSYFWQDDFRFLYEARTHGLGPEVILQDYNGHLLPGNFLLAGLIQGAGDSFTAAAITLVVGQGLSGLLMLWVLAQLFPSSLTALIGYVAYLFSPLGLVASTWWAYGIQAWPMQIALLGVIGCYLSWRRRPRAHWIVLSLAFLALGLVFYEKSLLVMIALWGVGVLILQPTSPLVHRLKAVASEWRFWLPPLSLALAWALLFVLMTASDRPVSRDVNLFNFLVDSLGKTLLPGLLGGPWTADGVLNTLMGSPSTGAVVLVALAWGLFVLWTVLRRRDAAIRAWILAACYVATLLVLVVSQRADFANFLARDPRYLLDAVPVLVICGLAAINPVADGTNPVAASPDREVTTVGPPHGSWEVPVRYAALAMVALVGSSWFTVVRTVPLLQHDYSRNYVRTLKAANEAEPGLSVVNAPAPSTAVLARSVREVAVAMDIPLVWDEATTDLRIVDGLGQLSQLEIANPEFAQVGPARDCGWYLGKPDATVDLAPALAPRVGRVMRFGYLSQSPVEITVAASGVRQSVQIPPGVGHVYFVTNGAVDNVSLSRGQSQAGLCITDVSVGSPWPVDS